MRSISLSGSLRGFLPALPFGAVLALAAVSASPVCGQAISSAATGPVPSRIELYGGYGYFRPFSSDIGSVAYEPVSVGGVASVAGYFSQHFGLQLEGNLFPSGDRDNNCVYTAQAGPIARMQRGRFVPFAHALGGAAKIGGPRAQTCDVWGWGVTGGGGLDYILPVLHDHLAVRPIQADFSYSQIDNGPYNRVTQTGGFGVVEALRLSAGLTLRFGGIGAGAGGLFSRGTTGGDTAMSCAASPAQVFSGEPVTINASLLHMRQEKITRFVWSTSGGRLTSVSDQATIDTTGLAPGNYSVGGRLLQGSGERQMASCMTTFAVEVTPLPTVSCMADRAAIHSGDPVVITTTASSPSGRPLAYSYTSSAGQVTAMGAKAALSTSGATPGTLTVTCSVADDRGGHASSTASVVVATPPRPEPLAEARALCPLSFERDRRRPDRVDNEAKACLDDVALTLDRETGARLILIGGHAQSEPGSTAAARVLNAADYLALEKGIDRARLDLRVGGAPGRTVSTMLVPPGATAPGEGTGFDAGSIHRSGQAYPRPGVSIQRRKPRTHRRHRRLRRVAP